MLSVNILLTIWSPANQVLNNLAINDLTSRHPNKERNIAEIKVVGQTKTESSEIAEELNLHFSSLDEKLASEIPPSNVEPNSYVEATITVFSLKDPPVSVVPKLLAKLNERKAAGLDTIPSRLLKMAGNIIAQSLAQIFIKSINTGIFLTE